MCDDIETAVSCGYKTHCRAAGDSCIVIRLGKKRVLGVGLKTVEYNSVGGIAVHVDTVQLPVLKSVNVSGKSYCIIERDSIVRGGEDNCKSRGCALPRLLNAYLRLSEL